MRRTVFLKTRVSDEKDGVLMKRTGFLKDRGFDEKDGLFERTGF